MSVRSDSPGVKPAPRGAYPRFFTRRLSICHLALFWVSLCAVPLSAQAVSGLDTRVPNTSLLIDLTSGEAPQTISASGLYRDIAAKQIAPGIIPYGVNAQLWSDGAYKTRYLALPGDGQIEFSPEGNWAFPANSVLVKNFHLDLVGEDGQTARQIVETRFLVKVGDTFQWKGFSYQWNESATEADLLVSSHEEVYTIADPADDTRHRSLVYLFPAPEDCGRCHTFGVGQVLGPRTSQLNGTFDYAAEGGGSGVAHQLTTLNQLNVFTEDIGSDFSSFPQLANPEDGSASIDDRARSYLQANCAHCHLPGGLRRTQIDLRADTPLAEMGIVDEISNVDDLGEADRRIVRPGDPDNSVLLLRTLEVGEQRMPPVATSVIDPAGTRMLRQWILSLGTPTAIKEANTVPAANRLHTNYPNPFNPATTLHFSLATPAPASLVVFDVTGRRVREVISGYMAGGEHRVAWDGRDDAGRQMGSGVYLARLKVGPSTQAQRLTLLR